MLVAARRLTYHFFLYAWIDLRNGRAWAVLCSVIAAAIPDLLCLGYLRGMLWRLAGAKISASSSVIRSGVFIEHPTRLTAGKNLNINRDTYLDATGGLVLGDDVTISIGCKILSMQHGGPRHQVEIMRETTIGSGSIIYAGAVILPGAKIAPSVVVAAGSVLRGETVPGGIYAGVPAQFKKLRSDNALAL